MKLTKILETAEEQEPFDISVGAGKSFSMAQYPNIRGDFYCDHAEIATLKGSPQLVGGDFYARYLEIPSLEGAARRVNGSFWCSNNKKLNSLKGAPDFVGHDFTCFATAITSLEGISPHIGQNLYCNLTDITSFHNVHKHAKHIGGYMTPPAGITSSVLGLLLIDGLRYLEEPDENWMDIINEHIGNGRDVLECQEELIQAGLKEFARL